MAREAERLHELVQPQQIVSGRGVRTHLLGLCGVLAVFVTASGNAELRRLPLGNLLFKVADSIGGKTVCPFGDAAIAPAQSSLQKFRAEFEEHIETARLGAGLPAVADEPVLALEPAV